jgi:hypothetical protein
VRIIDCDEQWSFSRNLFESGAQGIVSSSAWHSGIINIVKNAAARSRY